MEISKRTWNILVLNIGSTSAKVAYCQNDKIINYSETSFSTKELRALDTPEKLIAFHKKHVDEFLASLPVGMDSMDAIAARGVGKWGSYRHGAYLLSPKLAEDTRSGPVGHQGLYSSTIIGDELSRKYGIPAYLYDVVPTDEIPEIACICGIPNYRRRGASHTLNCRAVARKVAEMLGQDHNKSTFIISHMGGGFCTLAYKDGVIIETYGANEGCFTPERAGRVPSQFLTEVYTNPNYTKQDIHRLLNVDVGLYGHLGTSDCQEIQRRIADGDRKAELIYRAMAYQVSKDIGSLAPVVNGKVDAVILTGGIAHSEMMTGWIKERVGFIAPVIVVPGSMETEALAGGVTRVLNGEEQLNNYEDVHEKKLFEDLEKE